MKIIIALIITLMSFQSSAYADEKLIFSLDLVRHGDRYPTCELPKSPLKLNNNKGNLTQEGIQQELSLGRKLSEIYVRQTHLLPEIYEPNTLYTRSTDTKRTISSADWILTGLYPKERIPVHTVSINDDSLLIANPGYNPIKLINRYFTARREWNKIYSRYKTQFSDWSITSGLELSDANQLDCLADNLSYRKIHHLPLPDGITKHDADLAISLSDSIILSDFTNYAFPMGNEFLKSANKYISDAIHRKSNLKYILFVAHDNTLMSVMHTLRMPITSKPGYASRLNFSVYASNQAYIVKISLNGVVLKSNPIS